MNQQRFYKSILTALICITAQISAYAEDTQAPQIIDFAGGIETIDKLDLNTDPTLMSSMTTDWEVALESPDDANHNGHALLYHDGKLYVYMNKYVQGGKSEHVMRAYNASDGNIIEEKAIPFSSISEIWVGNSILGHTISVDDDGNFLFVFGNNANPPSLTLLSYSYETNTVNVLNSNLVLTNPGALNCNLSDSSLSFSKGVLSGNIFGNFTLSMNVFTTDYSTPISHCIVDLSINQIIDNDDNSISWNSLIAMRYDYKINFNIANVIDICDIDSNHALISHFPSSFTQTNGIDKFSLLEKESGNYALKANWSDESLMPDNSGYCLGMHVVRHDGHSILVYAKSYVDNCLYNVVLWDDPSSFANMKILGQIKVQGKIGVSNIYDRGIRQIVVQEPKAAATSDQHSASRTYPTKDYYERTTFYTYAPGAAIAKHHIVTEEDKIYTALTEISAESPLRLDGKTLYGCEGAPAAVYSPSGTLVAEYPAAAAIDLSILTSGIYIIKSGNSTIKAAL